MVTIQAQLPDELVREARLLAEDGWAGNLDEVLAEALRRYLESHGSRIAEQHVREDIEWGLHGSD